MIFYLFNEIVLEWWTPYVVYEVNKHTPKDFQVIIFSFDRVLEVVTFQLPLDFHSTFSYLKINGLKWDQGDSLLECLMILFFKSQLNPLRKSKVIGPLV